MSTMILSELLISLDLFLFGSIANSCTLIRVKSLHQPLDAEPSAVFASVFFAVSSKTCHVLQTYICSVTASKQGDVGYFKLRRFVL
jgi:hypothetical protein